ncbi:MAG: hypothetical protein K6F76_01635 [Clostridiales bacterium]|nr:hypothetical protein [Clostridiales bacterium]
MGGSQNAGHRNRLRHKFELGGLEILEEHEILELLLFYCIPRRDTNKIAHDLINKFGSLTNVLNADKDELTAAGASEKTSEYLCDLKNIFELYYASRCSNEAKYINLEILPDLIYRSFDEDKFAYYMILLNSRHKLIYSGKIKDKESVASSVVAMSGMYKAVYAVVAEYRKASECLCNSSDKEFVNGLSNNLKSVNIRLVDYIIMNKNECYSFRNGQTQRKKVCCKPL